MQRADSHFGKTLVSQCPGDQMIELNAQGIENGARSLNLR